MSEKRTLFGRLGQMQLKNPWTWPLIALVVLCVVVLIGTLAALFAGCASGGGGGFVDDGKVNTSTSTDGFTEHTFDLTDGRTVVCLTWSEWDYTYEQYKSGMDCLEPKAE